MKKNKFIERRHSSREFFLRNVMLMIFELSVILCCTFFAGLILAQEFLH